MFGAFSYLAYTYTEVTGFSSGSVPWLLVIYGGGLVAGNALVAWLGGAAISAGLGYSAPLFVGSGIVLAGLAVMLEAARRADLPRGPGRGRM